MKRTLFVLTFLILTCPAFAQTPDCLTRTGPDTSAWLPCPPSPSTAQLDYFRHKNLLLEPQAVLPIVGHLGRPFTNYVVGPDQHLVMWNCWMCGFNSNGGRFDLRDPSGPVSLRDITVNALNVSSHILLSDPSLPTYSDPINLYYDRTFQLETQFKTRYRGIPTANVGQFTLFGAYGAIVKSVSNYDTPFFVALTGEGDMLNMWNEMGDIPTTQGGNGVFRFGVRLNQPLTKYHMSGIQIGPGDAENPGYPPTGGMLWVNMPADWSKVPDPKTYLFRDDCMAPSFDTSKWNVRSTPDGVVQPDPLFQWHRIQHTVSGWGVHGLDGVQTYEREVEPTLEFDIVARANTTIIVGWLDDSGNRDFANFAHGMLFETNPANRRATIFEDGTNRLQTAVGSIHPDRIYHVRIKANEDGSATYEIQGKGFSAQLGGQTWTTLLPATSLSGDGVLRPAVFTSLGDGYVNDVKVY